MKRLIAASFAILISGLSRPAVIAGPAPESEPTQTPPRPPARSPLTPEQQSRFLEQRKKLPAVLAPNLRSLVSLLFVEGVEIQVQVPAPAFDAPLGVMLFDYYSMTWRELFDAIARRTRTSWRYDSARSRWHFEAPAMPLDFQITIAGGWQSLDSGSMVGFRPPSAPVGMDIYMMGHFSADDKTGEPALFDRIRGDIALRLASNFKRDISLADMTEDVVGDGLKALHFQATGPTGVVWRQWIVVHAGRAFAIVSAIRPEQEREILPDVRRMIASFRIPPVGVQAVPSSLPPAR